MQASFVAPMIDLILVLMDFFMSTVGLKQIENELGINYPVEATKIPVVITPQEEVPVFPPKTKTFPLEDRSSS